MEIALYIFEFLNKTEKCFPVIVMGESVNLHRYAFAQTWTHESLITGQGFPPAYANDSDWNAY